MPNPLKIILSDLFNLVLNRLSLYTAFTLNRSSLIRFSFFSPILRLKDWALYVLKFSYKKEGAKEEVLKWRQLGISHFFRSQKVVASKSSRSQDLA